MGSFLVWMTHAELVKDKPKNLVVASMLLIWCLVWFSMVWCLQLGCVNQNVHVVKSFE